MLGISTDNPSSAEAMRVAKDRLIARAEVKQSMFGDALEQVALIQLEMEDSLPENAEALEMQWRDPALASVSAKSANLLQAHRDRKSTRLNSSHVAISYAVFCL